jgi:hypothetical protein
MDIDIAALGDRRRPRAQRPRMPVRASPDRGVARGASA